MIDSCVAYRTEGALRPLPQAEALTATYDVFGGLLVAEVLRMRLQRCGRERRLDRLMTAVNGCLLRMVRRQRMCLSTPVKEVARIKRLVVQANALRQEVGL